MVGRAKHAALRRHVVRPAEGLVVAAALEGVAGLQFETSGNAGLELRTDAGNGGPRGVAPLLDDVALAVLADLLEREDVVEHRVESLDEQVGLHAAEGAVEIDRGAQAVGVLGPQVGREPDEDHLVVESVDVQILVIGLRGPEAARVA